MARRIRNPRYGMMVTDATGLWMLIARCWKLPVQLRDEELVWFAVSATDMQAPLFALFLDPDQFGEVA